MNDRHLWVEYEQPGAVVAVDGTLRGVIRTEAGYPRKRRRLLLKIGYFIHSRGTPETTLLVDEVLPENPENYIDGFSHPFEVRIPGKGPLSYDGQCMGVGWKVIVEEVRQYRFNKRHCFPFCVVLPQCDPPETE